MNREEKAESIREIEARLDTADTIIAADFRGLSVLEISALRSSLREVDAQMTVVKNTLARRAVSAKDREVLLPYLTGPTGLVWVHGDAAVAAKALDTFATSHQALEVKGGILEGEELDADGIKQLAKLPSRDELIAKLAGGVAAPLRGLAGSMNNMITGLARSLAAVQSQKASEG
ncbi:MAG: 50S ribosomal protein L10 [Thermoleophilia bacterium]